MLTTGVKLICKRPRYRRINSHLILCNEPLLRVNVWTHGPQDHVLLLTLHHIVVDGWSIWSMLEEVGQFYAQLKAGQQPQFAPPAYHYADFVAWQREMLSNKEEDLWAYWQQQLGDELPVLNLPTDYPRPSVQSYQGASVHFSIPQALLTRLKTTGSARAGDTLHGAIGSLSGAVIPLQRPNRYFNRFPHQRPHPKRI